MATTAINKNGQPRKSGSGRKKGSSSLVSVKLSDLRKHFNDDELIVCGRCFIEQKPDLAALYAPKIAHPTPEGLVKVTEF